MKPEQPSEWGTRIKTPGVPMTSEQRAEWFCNEILQVGRGIPLYEQLSASFRDAENDALERAATTVATFLSHSAISKPICEVVRGLKHQDGD
jgi:hypothetical protein